MVQRVAVLRRDWSIGVLMKEERAAATSFFSQGR